MAGVFNILGHITGSFIRRFGQNLPIADICFSVVANAHILETLAKQPKVPCDQTLAQVRHFLESIAVCTNPKTDHFDAGQAQVLSAGFLFVQQWYLDYFTKKDLVPALKNMIGLNYNNYTQTDKTPLFTKEGVRTILGNETYTKVCTPDMKSIAVELIYPLYDL